MTAWSWTVMDHNYSVLPNRLPRTLDLDFSSCCTLLLPAFLFLISSSPIRCLYSYFLLLLFQSPFFFVTLSSLCFHSICSAKCWASFLAWFISVLIRCIVVACSKASLSVRWLHWNLGRYFMCHMHSYHLFLLLPAAVGREDCKGCRMMA